MEDATSPPPWDGAWLTPRKTPLPTYATVPMTVILVQTIRAYNYGIRQKKKIPRVPPFMVMKATETITDRSATTYDFLLVIHSN